jgi:hypothetical protein
MEAVRSCETWVNIPDDSTDHSHRREDLKPNAVPPVSDFFMTLLLSVRIICLALKILYLMNRECSLVSLWLPFSLLITPSSHISAQSFYSFFFVLPAIP